jgi:hypothetical protein
VTTPPVLLLDVDGVVNVDLPSWPGGYLDATVTADGRAWSIRWAPELLAAIVDLHRRGLVEVRWCTTWSYTIDVLEQLWGLPLWEQCFTEPLPRRHKARLKYAQALAVIEQGRRLIWADDHAIPLAGAKRAALTGDGRALLIVPAELYGLTPHHINLITTFAAGDTE